MIVCAPVLPDTAFRQSTDKDTPSDGPRPLASLAIGRTIDPRRGRGYSRIVSFLKLLLPIAALLIVFVISFWQNIFGSTVTALERVDGTNVGDRLITPRFVGRDARDRPFVLEADYADELSGDSPVVSFSQPRGELLIDEGFIDLAAIAGTFDRQSEQLFLEGEVEIRRSDGLTFATEKLFVDLSEEHAWTDLPVAGSGDFGEIDAEGGVDIQDGGNTIRFKGPATLTLNPATAGSLP